MRERFTRALQNIRSEASQTWSDLIFRYHADEFQREVRSTPSQSLMNRLRYFQNRGRQGERVLYSSLTTLALLAGSTGTLAIANTEMARSIPWTAATILVSFIVTRGVLRGTVAANCERRAEYIQSEIEQRLQPS